MYLVHERRKISCRLVGNILKRAILGDRMIEKKKKMKGIKNERKRRVVIFVVC
jgi:hypothetical protein